MRKALIGVSALLSVSATGQGDPDLLSQAGSRLIADGFAKPLGSGTGEPFLKVAKLTLQTYSKQRLEIERILVALPNTARCADATSAMTGVKAVVDLLVLSAYEATTEGRISSASNDYVLALKACRYLENKSWRGVMTAAALRTMVYSDLAGFLSVISLDDLKRLSGVAAELTTTASFVEAVDSSAVKAQAVFEAAFEPGADSSNSEEVRRIASLLSEANVSERMKLRESVSQAIRARFAGFRRQFESPGPAWAGATPQEGLEAAIVSALPETSSDHWFSAYLWAQRDFTKAKLVRLHCLIRDHFLNHKQLPSSIREVGSSGLSEDVLNGQQYRYEILSAGNYKLYSLGSPDTGPIDLRATDPIY